MSTDPVTSGHLTIAHGRTLLGELEARTQDSPQKIWLIYENAKGRTTTLTYGAFLEQVYRAAHLLNRCGVGSGDKILLHLSNCPQFLVLWFAAAAMRATMVPTNPLSSPAELQYLCEHSGAVLVVVPADGWEGARSLQSSCPRVRNILVCGSGDSGEALSFETELARMPQDPPAVKPQPDDEVAILYTSGTTSKPKGCIITNTNYIHAGETVAAHMGVTPDDRQLVVLPLFHGNAQYYSTMSALVVGASVIVAQRFSASRYFTIAARHGATMGSLFSAPMRMILAQSPQPLSSDLRLRLIFFAQSLTPLQLREWHERFDVPLLQIYGMTEQLGQPLANPLHTPRDNMSIGRPTLAFRCRVVEDDRDVPMGMPGELLVAGIPGVSLMKGYFRDPTATAAVMRDGWLRTGDNVRVRRDGFFEFVDRAKDMIKRAGENVAASEVEAVIKEHPCVYDSAVVGVPDAVRDEAIKAFVVLRPGAQLTAGDITSWCAARLARFRVPEFVEFRDELPRTSVGKIQKHLLRQSSPST